MRSAAPFIAIVLLTLLAYASAIGHAPVWDDRIYIFGNPAVEEARWSEILARPAESYHRPVIFSTFAVERAWLGSGPAAMRLVNVLLHAAVACLLLLAARRLGAPTAPATAGALLFALHPVQTEAVTYISGRTDLLAAFFSLLALLLHARWRRWGGGAEGGAHPGALAGALLCYLLALGSKESAALLPLTLLGGALIFERTRQGKRSLAGAAAQSAPYLAALALYAAWRAALPGKGLALAGLAGIGDRLPAILEALADHARLLLFPINLHLERFVTAAGWSAALLSGIFLIGAVLLAWRRGSPSVRFWILWAGLAYLPTANLIPVYPGLPPETVFAPEHFLYAPSAGALLAVAIALGARLPGRRGAPLLSLVLACFVLLAVSRNADWRDEETLYRHTLRFSPESARVRLNLGNLYLERGDLDAARAEFAAGLARAPHDTDLLTNAGLAALELRRPERAVRLLREVVRLEPRNAQAWSNLAAALATGGRFRGARTAYGRALALEPSNADARAGLRALDRIAPPSPDTGG